MAENGLDVSVSHLAEEALNVLYRLNTRRLMLSGGPLTLPRDWRGLANLAGISSQDVQEHQNMVQWTLETWVKNDGASATVRQLFQHLELIDRHDVKDDLINLATADRLVNRNEMDVADGDVEYDAMVLFAEADQEFIDSMTEKMTEKGFNLLTKPYRQNTELTNSRCRHTVLIYSAAFFQSLDYKFYFDYSEHMRNSELTQYRLIPCIYEQCKLPAPLQFHFPLYVHTIAYDFWDQLAKAIQAEQWPRLLAPNPSSLSSTNQRQNDAAQRSLIRSIAQWYRRHTRVVLSRIHPNRSRQPFLLELNTISFLPDASVYSPGPAPVETRP